MTLRSTVVRASAFTAALLSLSVLISAGARADEPGRDEVTLKNGGSIRGTVVATEPGTAVKILEVGQKEPRVIPWSQVSDVEKDKYAPKIPAAPGPAGPGYGSAPPPTGQPVLIPHAKLGDPGVVRLHIESPQPASVIEHRSALVGAVGNYGLVLTQERRVCTSPCDTIVDGSDGRTFRLADDDYPSGDPFSLAAMSGNVTMQVKPGSKGMRLGGGLAMTVGIFGIIGGVVVIPIAQLSKVHDLSTSVEVSSPNVGLRSAGIGMLVGGVAVLGGGIALLVVGATKIRLEPDSPPPKTAQIEPRYWMGEF